MCGIFGGVGIKDPESSLKLMGRALHHRGPDEEGYYYQNSIALGHTRLSIIDLSTGQQPMFSVDGQCVIVFNGEIYNFQEIRKDLIKKGHTFRTASDTEVILNAYREWGMECLNRFNGMFAFALWDKSIRKLWIVRDRVGKKPVYFISQPNAFYFASEAKALWALPFFHGTLDARAIDQYLTYRYVPSDRTFFQEIRKLPAGQWMLIDEGGRLVERKEWWRPPPNREEIGRRSLLSYREEFSDLFSNAVRLRMISDVPLGAFLSSGIDSVSIAIEMAKHSRPTLFTIGFGDESDETNAAAIFAKELGAIHHILRLEEKDFDLLPQAVASMDEPYGDPIILPTYLLAKKAAQHVKVVLTGDGADEAMGGYIHQTFFRQMPNLPLFLRRPLASLLKRIPVQMLDKAFSYSMGMGQAGRDRLSQLFATSWNSAEPYRSFAVLFSDEERRRLYSPDFMPGLHDSNDEFDIKMAAHFSKNDFSLFDRTLQWDLRTWFAEQTLMKFDRLTMANSIEGRCPYADRHLLEFFLKLPLDVYKRLCHNKTVVRDAYQARRSYLPRTKKPFYLPMHRGFANRLKKFQDDVLAPDQIRQTGLFCPNFIESLRQRREASPLLIDKQIMCLTVLTYWLMKNKS